MRTTIHLLCACLMAASLVACSGESESKDQCRTDQDCLDGRKCNFDLLADLGLCMQATLDGFFMCTADKPCPAGQFCFNGLCAPGCMTDADCADNQYCDTTGATGLTNDQMCVNKQVPTCQAAGDCAANQTCVQGLCSAVAEQTHCTPRPDGQDGCDQFSICLDMGEVDEELNICVTFPPCPQDGQCPLGQVGSVCNEQDIPNKARICLTGLCKGAPNCPAGFSCLVPGGGSLGMCSDGSLGMPCLQAGDCQDGLGCLGAMAGMPGFCFPGSGGDDCEEAGGTCLDTMSGLDCPTGATVDVTKTCDGMTEMCCMPGGDPGGCSSDADCPVELACNFDQVTGTGTCMPSTDDGFFMCTPDMPCPADQFCFNGFCAPACMTDADCPAEQYCDTSYDHGRCINQEVPECGSGADCADNQECIQGLCSAGTVEQSCTPRLDGQDGCDEYSICLDMGEDDEELNSCVAFPPCPQDGDCPVGQTGSVCNDGDIPGKARICLSGLCKEISDCPNSFNCLTPGGSTLGICSDGTFGMPCLESEDCQSGLTCMVVTPGSLGFCVEAQADCISSGGSCADFMSGENCPAGTQPDFTLPCEGVTEVCCI